MLKIYLIGSLKNPQVPLIAKTMRSLGYEVFDDWYGAGENADDCWQAYEKTRGRHYSEALYGEAAQTIYNFDKKHLDEADVAVLVAPAGKSGHMELGYMVGKGKQTYVLFDGEPERWDVMYQFVQMVFFDLDDLMANIAGFESIKS